MARILRRLPLVAAALLSLSLITQARVDQQQLSPGTSLSLLNANGVFRSSAMSSPLGLGSGALADERFSASSVYRAPLGLYQPWLARAHAQSSAPSAGYWRSGRNTAGEYLAVDLGRDYVITAVASQGAADGSGWVTKYKLQTSRDGISWKTYPTQLAGNSDGNTVVVNDLHDTITARYVRFVADEFVHLVSMRVELYGFSPECGAQEEERVVGIPCAARRGEGGAGETRGGEGEGEAVLTGAAPERKYGKGFPLGIEDGIISDGALSASSTYFPTEPVRHDAECDAENAALKSVMPMRFAQIATEAGEPLLTVTHAEGAEVQARAVTKDARFAADRSPVQPTDGKADCNVFVSYAPRFGRLNQTPQPYKSGGWKPASDAVGEYLQVDLGSLQEIDAVGTQGRAGSLDWVTAFTLEYSVNGRQWEAIPKDFAANSDPITLVKHVLPRALLARYLRFVVRAWNKMPNGGIGLRVEAYGPGRGQGCLLRCHATKLAVNSGVRDIDAALTFANGGSDAASFVEMEALTSIRAEVGVDATDSISCCGCSCCALVMPGGCGAKGASTPAGAKEGSVASDATTQNVVADTVRVLLRGGAPGGGEGPAYGGPGARKAVAAVDQPVAAAVQLPQAAVPGTAKTYYVVQKE